MTEERTASGERPAAMQAASRDAGRQYALPLVIRVERASPPAGPTRWRARRGRCCGS